MKRKAKDISVDNTTSTTPTNPISADEESIPKRSKTTRSAVAKKAKAIRATTKKATTKKATTKKAATTTAATKSTTTKTAATKKAATRRTAAEVSEKPSKKQKLPDEEDESLGSATTPTKRKRYKFWTKPRCARTALRFQTKGQFQLKKKSVYNICSKNGWLTDVCAHMTSKRVNHGYWTRELIQKTALKYQTRAEFTANNKSAYEAARKSGILQEVCAHMVYYHLPNGYWNYDKVKEEALKYQYKIDFQTNCKSGYEAAYKNGWLGDIAAHMVSKSTNLPRGYWSKEKCLEEALKYETRDELIRNCKQAYISSYKKGWLHEVCAHMISGRTKKRPITKEKCIEEALQFESKQAFKNGKPKLYEVAANNEWLEQVCEHMTPFGKFMLDKCKQEALKYKTKESFESGSHKTAYQFALSKGWLNHICQHMKK